MTAAQVAGTLSRDAMELLRNPVWHALRTEHAPLAIGGDLALRYPAEYIPFAGLASTEPEAFDQLRDLLTAGESIYLASEEPLPDPAGFQMLTKLPGLQMIYDHEVALPQPAVNQAAPPLELLTQADVPEMLALKEIAFPGYYGPRAPALGSYYGIRTRMHGEEELIAMAGERLSLPGLREVSAVCTHPRHTGQGHAARLIRRLVEDESAAGHTPFLHLAAVNVRALALYERLGFKRSRAVFFTHLHRA